MFFFMCVALRAVAPESVLFSRAKKERAETHTHTRSKATKQQHDARGGGRKGGEGEERWGTNNS